ncbi:Cystathionine beta-lyase PatB [Chryseobacterium aquaeductus]|uniref:cysteine-S-conjugate beta-lyase n=1 Tax=Chryseobacterium aquaeductus TaxID=2675056 RepID=A0A9N8QTI2_9FLAO|nr:MalY/PatB family protein [Chryseobacterium aquaeductus]CAA7332427.1 Cystathionine beta-lyase PatB [Chryseobacterium potabilaquae]CAD7816344.1 Cystathionine beta-lyase PatB [Chryseobacterium aquaeductus]
MANKYNFDEIIDRRGTNSVKWNLAKDQSVLPMWVADMDFKTAPEITEAILKKLSHGVFGYSNIPADFFESIINWWKEIHHFNIEKDSILTGPGMIPTLSAILRTFVKSGENIIIQPPVYNHFYTLLENCEFGMTENNLIYQNGIYAIDIDDLERKASDPKTKLLLLCNPHNPVGRVWKRDELEKIAEICSKNQVIVVSDKIHADLVFEGHKHIPFASVAESFDLISFTCGSPCKTFNLSGLPISYIISENKEALKNLQKTFEIQETNYPNPIAAEALIAAYTQGKEWLDELKIYLYDNYQYLLKFFEQNLPGIKVIPLEATYLVWLDCKSLKISSKELTEILLEEEKLWLNPGTMYGGAGEGFLRINIACPRELLIEGLEKLQRFYNTNFILTDQY